MNFNYKKLLPHLFVVFAFIIIALAYFSPVLQGKVIYQSDIAQYTGMAKEQNDFRESEKQEPYWTNSAFGGMPTYQLGANYPYNFVKEIDRTIRFLPRPADYLFLYFIGIYILFLVLKVDYKIAFLGALAFGFSTYLIIILGVGHNAKAHAIAYMPMVLAGIIYSFKGNYFKGSLLFTVAMALEINANHPQMTYYLLLLVLVLGLAYLIDFYKKEQLPQFFKALVFMVVGVVIAVGVNATSLMATQEYGEFSTRGNTGLTINADGTEKTQKAGLEYDYITEYSYGIAESFNLFIPRFMGGSSSEKLDEDSASYESLLKIGASPQQAKDFIKNAPTYWGDQTYIGAPAYIGASLIFLFVFALFLIRGRLKWWIVGGSILALILSWGDNFAFVTKFFINYVPLYNKFRAVSSIQVIIELCVPILGIYALAQVFQKNYTKEEILKALKNSTIVVGGLALVFLLFKSMFLDFTGKGDRGLIEQVGPDFVRSLREDRKAIFTEDTLRSLFFVLACAGIIWAFIKEKVSKNLAIAGLGILIVIDLVAVDRRYVNNDDFVSKVAMEQPFQQTSADAQILEDKGHHRVLDVSGSPFNSARASYFHKSIGGYHAAKPGRIQDLFDFHIANGNQEVLDMLNMKYMIISNQGKTMAQMNPEANGNAWFVDEVSMVKGANEAILALDSLNTKKNAVVEEKFAAMLPRKRFENHSTDIIQLKSYQPNELVYEYKLTEDRLAVFSEVYYPHGWHAYVDGEKIEHLRADYVLRAAMLPKGNHELVFKFQPEVVQQGSMITLASGIVFILLILVGVFYTNRKKTT
ncbi:YfhO family protein [Mesonia ostreae]|uniref:YfhO family protein n=1 Tax=Mesonia ostreae TaxID=861110 RepID=A0ABU2KK85_9FLAO|nr:YfhO family protein [Mesonia ostreae]MDT0295073.1 YfhO family protein [Mesonia ostreae]